MREGRTIESRRMLGDRQASALMVVLAVLARASVVLVLASHHTPRSTYEHGEIAANLVAGRGFSMEFLGVFGPTSQQAPIYPLVVAGAYAIAGVETPRSLLILELGQALLGGVMVMGVLALARELFPGRRLAHWLAGGLVALHPTLVYAATHVQVASLAATLLVWTLALASRAGRTGGVGDTVATGVLLGLLALTDPILSLAVVGVGLAIGQGVAFASRPRSVAIRRVLLAVGVAAVVISPWLARNAVVHHEFVAIKSTFGYAFWQGNCAQSEGTDKVVRPSVGRILDRPNAGSLSELNQTLWLARHEAGCIDDIALSRADRAILGKVPETERSRVLFRRAWSDLAARPGRYGELCLKRLRYFVLFDETNPKTRLMIYRAPHLGLSLFAMIGLCLAPTGSIRRLAPTLATAAVITLFHTLTIVSARFHIPLEPLMAIWGAGASVSVASGVGWFSLGWRPRHTRLDRRPACTDDRRPSGIASHGRP